MKYKIIGFIVAFGFIFLSLNNHIVYARTYTLNPDNYSNVYYITGYASAWYSGTTLVTAVCGANSVRSLTLSGDSIQLSFESAVFNVSIGSFSVDSSEGTQSGRSRFTEVKSVVVYKGSVDFNGLTTPDESFNNWEDYQDSIAPTWWERVAQIFTDFATSPAMGAVLSGDWLGYINEVLFGELWSVQVGEGEDELAEFYTVSATPSPSPTPIPTQIPVQVNIDPTTGNVTYHYTIDVSGTPVPTYSPVNPNPPTGTGGGGSELTEPFGVTDYYEPDDSLSIPNLRIFQFQLDLPGSTTDIGVDSLDNNVEMMNGYLEDNADAITTVSSFFQVIPSDWFLLLGAIACFPIIAAMIKSLLGG